MIRGTTPWDNLTRTELLQTIWRYYFTIDALYLALFDLQKTHQLGKTLFVRQAEQYAEQISAELSLEQSAMLYRDFFRYAPCLLFKQPGLWDRRWAVCDHCGQWQVGEKTTCRECGQTVRPLTWLDLRPAAPETRLICLDFDGVLHAYTTPWERPDLIPDPPVNGACSFVQQLQAAGYTVVIHSSRARYPEGLRAMSAWLEQHGFPPLTISQEKPPALLTLDDRAWCFDGTWPTLAEIEQFKPWKAL
jgi:hypothetical protein